MISVRDPENLAEERHAERARGGQPTANKVRWHTEIEKERRFGGGGRVLSAKVPTYLEDYREK